MEPDPETKTFPYWVHETFVNSIADVTVDDRQFTTGEDALLRSKVGPPRIWKGIDVEMEVIRSTQTRTTVNEFFKRKMYLSSVKYFFPEQPI